jgi:hypothetical protein
MFRKNRRDGTASCIPGIRLHSDSELAEVLGAGIVERQTIHEWPLSCVQRVVLEGRAVSELSWADLRQMGGRDCATDSR